MRQEIKLYIGNQEVEFSTPPEILYNYTLTDLKNPTIIKNSYSKTITIEGTPRNNQLFGSIWNLERIQAYNGGSTGPSFNPLQKADFKIYVNGDLYESGYVKLTNVTKTGRNIEYQCNLFGGLGQFFYNLSYTHNEAGETEGPDKLQLKDLSFVDEGQVAQGDDAMNFDFVINKETLFDAWNTLNGNPDAVYSESGTSRPNNYLYGHKWREYINFIPTAYNGIPENFDAEHVLINQPYQLGGMMPSISGYYTIGGYALGTFPEAMTQEATLDFRSYLQRPVIKMSAILGAIALPENNGGFEVKYGSHFFNNSNPYYTDAWMTLPMLQDMEIDKVTDYSISSATITSSGSTFAKVNFTQPTGTSLNNFQVTIDVKYTLNSTPSYYPQMLFTDTYYTGDPNIYSGDIKWYKKRGTQMLQLIAFDAANTPIAESNVIMLQSTKYDGNDLDNGYSKYKDSWNAVYPKNVSVPATEVRTGCYRRQSGNVYYWTEGAATGSGKRGVTFTFSEPIQNFHHLGIKHLHPANEKYQTRESIFVYLGGSGEYSTDPIGLYSSMRTRTTLSQSLSQVKARDNYKGNYSFVVLDFHAEATAYDSFFSGTKITKDKLLATDDTPASYLIDYCKLFGLYFYRDAAEKSDDPETYPNGVIHILDRAEFYKMAGDWGESVEPEIVNLDKMIDRSKPISITPQLPETKWYNFNVEQLETDAESKYYDTYEVPLGLKRVNTGYNFDAEATNVYEDNLFRGAPQVLEKNKYFYVPKVVKSSGPLDGYVWESYVADKYTNVYESVRSDRTYLVGYKYDWADNPTYKGIHINSSYVVDATSGMTSQGGGWYKDNSSNMRAYFDGAYLYWYDAPLPIKYFDPLNSGYNKYGAVYGAQVPYYITNGFKYALFKSNGSGYDTTEAIPVTSAFTKTPMNSAYTGYDIIDRVQLHGNENKSIEGDGVLVFHDFSREPYYNGSSAFTYWISDDVDYMGQLNSGEPCWLLTPRMKDANGNVIAYPMHPKINGGLPYFTRTLRNDSTNYNVLSWDFGNSQEVFIPEVYNTDEQGIYHRMWGNYIKDLYSVNNRKLTCSVLLKEKPNPDWLRRFYWFDNAVWVLNKIKDWSVSTYDSTEMEFVKVQDVQDYNLREITTCGMINIVFDQETFPWDDVEINGKVTISDGGHWSFYGESDNPVSGEYIDGSPVDIDWEEPEIYVTPMTGSGLTTSITLHTGENDNAMPRRFYITMEGNCDEWLHFSVLQEGNGDPYVAITNPRVSFTEGLKYLNTNTPAAQKIDFEVHGHGLSALTFGVSWSSSGQVIYDKYEYKGDLENGVVSLWLKANTDDIEKTIMIRAYGKVDASTTLTDDVRCKVPSCAFELDTNTLEFAYNETSSKEVTITPNNNIDYSIMVNDPDNAFNINLYGHRVYVYPKEQNDTDYDHVAEVVVTNGAENHTINITQKGDPPATSAQVWWATGNKSNDDFYLTGGTGNSLGAFSANGRVYFESSASYGHVTMVGSSQFRVSCDRNDYGTQRSFAIRCRSSKTGEVLAYHWYYQGR